MKIKNTVVAVIASAAVASSGCATLFAKDAAKVTTASGSTHSLSKKEDHNIEGCQIDSGIYWGWVVLDLFLTGPIGIIVDAVTGDWKHLDSDCAAIVNNPS